MRITAFVFPALVVVVCGACDSKDLARAGESRFSVDHAAELMGENLRIEPDTQSARVLAELWVDYTLLGNLLRTDPDLETLDVSLMTRAPLEQTMLSALQAEALRPDTSVSDEELQDRFATEMPGAQIEVSHILFALPRTATPEQKDSVLNLAGSVVRALEDGGDFGRMARLYSADRGSASQGGSLGSFRRGDMLPELERAALALRPGEISAPTESTAGIHVLRLDRLTIPDFDQIAPDFRRQVQLERLAEAEAAFIQELEASAGLALESGAVGAARSIARSPASALGNRAAERALVSYDGGAYTVREYQELLRMSPPQFLAQVTQTGDQQLETLILRLARQELLLREAEDRGMQPEPATMDSLTTEARQAVRSRAQSVGLDGAGESLEVTVDSILARILSGRTEIQPLGGITFLLRDQFPWSLNEDALEAAVEQASALSQTSNSP